MNLRQGIEALLRDYAEDEREPSPEACRDLMRDLRMTLADCPDVTPSVCTDQTSGSKGGDGPLADDGTSRPDEVLSIPRPTTPARVPEEAGIFSECGNASCIPEWGSHQVHCEGPRPSDPRVCSHGLALGLCFEQPCFRDARAQRANEPSPFGSLCAAPGCSKNYVNKPWCREHEPCTDNPRDTYTCATCERVFRGQSEVRWGPNRRFCSFTCARRGVVGQPIAEQRPETAEPLRKALDAWSRWYSARLDRINNGSKEDYTGYEQDLFEALGCLGVPETGGTP